MELSTFTHNLNWRPLQVTCNLIFHYTFNVLSYMQFPPNSLASLHYGWLSCIDSRSISTIHLSLFATFIPCMIHWRKRFSVGLHLPCVCGALILWASHLLSIGDYGCSCFVHTIFLIDVALCQLALLLTWQKNSFLVIKQWNYRILKLSLNNTWLYCQSSISKCGKC